MDIYVNHLREFTFYKRPHVNMVEARLVVWGLFCILVNFPFQSFAQAPVLPTPAMQSQTFLSSASKSQTSQLPTLSAMDEAAALMVSETIKAPAFFYHGQDYGSESQFGPFSVLINVGLVVPGRLGTSPKLTDFDLQQGWRHYKQAITNPSQAVNESGGLGRALEKEVIPFAHESGAWLPNYSLHFLGEGMLSRKLEEYFIYQGVQGSYTPKLLAWSTVFLAQVANEVVEDAFPWDQQLDPLADFYFNLAGMVAFSFDGFARWFTEGGVEYYFWPGQAVIDVQDGALFNQGESYFMRFGQGWKWAIATGMPANGVGVSLPLDDVSVEYLTFMLGTDVIIPKANYQYEEAQARDDFNAQDIAKYYTTAFNVYWDRKGSLMASSSLSFAPSWQLNINVYPMYDLSADIKMGGYTVLSEEGANVVGLTFDFTSLMFGRRF